MKGYAQLDQKSLNRVLDHIGKLPKRVQERRMVSLVKKAAAPLARTITSLTPVRKTQYDVISRDKESGKKRLKKIRPDSLQRKYRQYRGGWGRGRDELRGRRPGVKDGAGVIKHTTIRGNLRKSVNVRKAPNRYKQFKHGEGAEVWVGRSRGKYDGWYYYMLEYGTKYQRGRFIHRRAFQMHKGPMRNKMSNELAAYVKKEARILGFWTK